MAEIENRGPRTWGAASRMLQKGEGNVTDEDIFGDDPLKPKDKKDPLEYLGHFASDRVADDGHNTPAVKRVGAGPHAKQGYHVIEGNYDTPVCTPKMKEKREADRKQMYVEMGMKFTPMDSTAMPKPDKAPLRKKARDEKKAAGPGKGPLRSNR